MDRDGRPDLVTGSDDCCDPEPGFHWFRRGADGRFTAMGEVLVRVAGIRDNEWDGMRRFRMKVRRADWDGDGRLDVLAVDTRSRGRIARTLGRWDAAAGAVEATAEVEGSPAVSEVSAQPVEVDWVSDGWLDLITADHALATPDAKVYTCRIWWQRNEGTPAFARLGPRRLLTSLEDWGRRRPGRSRLRRHWPARPTRRCQAPLAGPPLPGGRLVLPKATCAVPLIGPVSSAAGDLP